MQTIRNKRAHRSARVLAWLAFFVLVAGLDGATARAAVSSVTVTLDLTRYPKVAQLDAGEYAGLSPGRVVIHVGDSVVFANSDSRHHTATFLGEGQTFPASPRWTDSALHASGSIGSGAWSTGDLAPGSRSSPISATKPGTYLYGCFFDYSAGMRGEIVVQP